MIGGYVICIEDSDGKIIRQVERFTRATHPMAGDELVIDGTVYRVQRVRHDQLDNLTRRIYTTPRVFVRLTRAGLISPIKRH
jgi:hypothetical protein